MSSPADKGLTRDLAFKFVVPRAGVCVGTLTAVGIEVRVIADDTGSVGDDARRAKGVFGEE
jgi:hypothetical protein